MAQAVLTASTPGSVNYNNKTHNYNYTFSGADLDLMKLLSTACLITKVTLHIECATNLSNNAPSLNYTVYCGSHNYSGSFDFPKDHASDCKREITNIALSGTDVFGSNIASNAYRISYSVGSSIMSWFKYWINTTSITIDYTVRNWVTFKDADGTILRAAHACNMTATPTAPQVSVPSGYSFDGWKSSLDDTTYASVPPCTGADVIYTAVYHKIDYHVGLSAVNSDSTSLDVGNKLTGSGTYQIDNTFAIVADAGDTTVSGNIFLFDYWTFRDANGNDMFLDESGKATHFNNEALASLTVSADTISAWWSAPAASGEHQGEYWIYGIAHYYQVYDIALSIKTDTLSDPAGLGKDGVTSMQIISNGVTQEFTKAQVVAGVTARVTNKTIEIRTTVTSAQEYSVYSVGCGGTQYDKLTSSWEQNTYVTRGDWESSTGYYYLRFNKKYFDITINGDTDQVVKVYRIGSNNTRTLISPTHIARASKIVIEADTNAMLQTTSDTAVSTISPDVSGNTSVSGGIGTITSLLQNHTIAVTRTQATCTVTKTINSDGAASVSETIEVVRSNQYRCIVAAESGYHIADVTFDGLILVNGEVRQSRITYPQSAAQSYDGSFRIFGNSTIIVNRVQDPQAYVTIQTPISAYGTTNVTSATSILKSQFTGFVIQSITALPSYEVVTATYKWMAGSTTVGTGAINPITGATIQYPNATIPSDQDVVLIVEVQYRKNIIYHSHKQNGQMIHKRPQSLWYTPVGQAPKRVVAVYAQTQDHPSPVLLYGDVT